MGAVARTPRAPPASSATASAAVRTSFAPSQSANARSCAGAPADGASRSRVAHGRGAEHAKLWRGAEHTKPHKQSRGAMARACAGAGDIDRLKMVNSP